MQALLRRLVLLVLPPLALVSALISYRVTTLTLLEEVHFPAPKAASMFLALRPFGNRSLLYQAPEVSKGHALLRERTYPTSRRVDTCHHCFSSRYPPLLRPRGVCANRSSAVDLLIIVTTVPGAYLARAAVRETWGRYSRTPKGRGVAGPVFLFGTGWGAADQARVVKEHAQYGDVLQDAYVDSYYNLSLKVLSGYHWFTMHCAHARFVLRTADDNYVNVPHLLGLVWGRGATLEPRMVGSCYGWANVKRHPRDKWYVTQNEYPHRRYPAYCIGTAVLTSALLTRRLLNTSSSVPYFVLEDIYFGLVLREARHTVLNHGGFNIRAPVVTRAAKGVAPQCRLKRGPWYSVHGVDPAGMRLTFDLCQQDKASFNQTGPT